MSSGFAFALAARSAMKDTASAGSGILTLASAPEEGAPAGAAPGRAAPAPGPGRGAAGEMIRVQTVRPAARNSVSTAEPAVVSCQRLAAEAEAWPANGAPHSVQNLAPATAFVPHWAQKRTDIWRPRAILTETPRAAQPRQIGGGHHHKLAAERLGGSSARVWIPPTRAGIRLALPGGHACPRASKYFSWRTTRRSGAPPCARSRGRAGR